MAQLLVYFFEGLGVGLLHFQAHQDFSAGVTDAFARCCLDFSQHVSFYRFESVCFREELLLLSYSFLLNLQLLKNLRVLALGANVYELIQLKLLFVEGDAVVD